jgi:hypothetical protein
MKADIFQNQIHQEIQLKGIEKPIEVYQVSKTTSDSKNENIKKNIKAKEKI